jgi:hypothetical protein
MSNTEFTIKNKLMEVMSEFDTWCFCNNIDCIKAQNFDLAVKDLEAFISDQVAKARIDELEHLFDRADGERSARRYTAILEQRIKVLRTRLNGVKNK